MIITKNKHIRGKPCVVDKNLKNKQDQEKVIRLKFMKQMCNKRNCIYVSRRICERDDDLIFPLSENMGLQGKKGKYSCPWQV